MAKAAETTGMRAVLGRTAVVAALAVAAGAAPAEAQRRVEPRMTLSAFGGVATYGRFLELQPLDLATGEHELQGSTGATAGLSLGFFPKLWGFDDLAAQLGFMWTTSEFEFENDDPRIDDDLSDADAEAGDFQTYTASLSLMKFLGRGMGSVAPYAIAGVSATWWNLDADLDEDLDELGNVQPPADGDETLFRWGGMGGFGVQVRATDALSVRLEAARYEIRNPFDGDGEDAFRVTRGETMDEPDRVGVNRFSLGLTYTWNKRCDGPCERDRHGRKIRRERE